MDPRSQFLLQLLGPIRGVFAITPHNTDRFIPTRQLTVQGAGNVALVYEDGSEHIRALEANREYDIAVIGVKITGTTATGIEGYR